MIDLQYGDILKQGWEKTKANYGMILLVIIIYLGITASFSHISETFKDQGFISLVAQLITFAVNVFLSIGFIRCFLQAADGQKVEISTLFSGGDVFFSFLIGSVAYSLLCMLGFLLLFVPGIIWSIKYSFVQYLIADKGLGVKEAFSRSAQITDGYKWNLFCLMALTGFINIGGILCFGVGLLVTIPWTCMIYPLVFRVLSGEEAVDQSGQGEVDDNSDIQTFNNWQ